MKQDDAWSKEALVGDRLPYLAQIDERTVLLRDGRLLQVMSIEGQSADTLSISELNYLKSLRDSMLQSIGSSRFALYHHICRTKVEPGLGKDFPDPFSQHVDDCWSKRLAARRMFRNVLYLSVIRRPSQGRSGLVERLARLVGRSSQSGLQAELAAERRELDAASEALCSALAPYGARILEAYDVNGHTRSEPAEFLAQLFNGFPMPIALLEGDLGQQLPAGRISFGAQTAELSEFAGRPRSYVGIASIKAYPATTTPGMLDELLRLPLELVVSQSFGFVDRGEALGRMNLAVRRMRAADDEALSLRADLSLARDDVASGRSNFGQHHLTIAVRGDAAAAVDEGIAEVQAALADLGILAVREDIALEPAFWAQFPGNFDFIARRALVSTQNLASFASFHNGATGQADGNHWGDAVTVLETNAAGPYYFNFHEGDLGNFTVIGPSGSGKTVIINFLLSQARRFNPRIVFFDKDRGAEIFLRSMGGQYEVLRAGKPSSLNPLHLEDTAENRQFLVELFSKMASIVGNDIGQADTRRLVEAVATSMGAPKQFRRFAKFIQLLRGDERPTEGDLYSRLLPWWGSGEHAWLFDNAEDELDLDQPVLGFDMTQILDHPVTRTPAMMYLFHRVEQRLDGTPTIIVVDEGWKALDDVAFTRRIRDWEKTIRKRNGIVGFATQSAEDASSSSVASAIIEQSATHIFLANPKAQPGPYMDSFGLSEREFDIVRRLDSTSHSFLVKQGGASTIVRLDLSGEDDMLTVLSGREKTVRILDELRAGVGNDPDNWLPRLLVAAR